jgi:formyl-CoA transferase/CoA:oxalate CoA-transferase
VIKVEEPGAGDEARHWGPPFFQGESAYILSMNRNKRGVALNLKAPAGRDLCLRLIDRADVVVENFRPGVADRLGLGYPALRERNPALVYCSISAYGQDGPLAGEPGYDLIMQGAGGLMSVTGEVGGRPLKAGVAETDILAGTNAAAAILAALIERDGRPAGRAARGRAGGNGRAAAAETAAGAAAGAAGIEGDSAVPSEGRYLDVSLFDGQVALMGYHLVGHLLSGRVPAPAGNALPYIVPYQTFKTADIEITIGVNNDRLWQAFCAAVERPDLAADPRFRTNAERVGRRDELVPQLEALFLTRPGDEWLARLRAHGVPAGAINTVDRVAAHPQVAARGLIAEVEHPVGRVPTPTAPWRTDLPAERAPPPRPTPSPLLGQHTAAVLHDLLGCGAAEIARLEAAGVVACAQHDTRPTSLQAGSPSPLRGEGGGG